jgi:hypothetical protein
MSSNDTAYGYSKKTNEKGEVTYTRKRIVQEAQPQTYPEPIQYAFNSDAPLIETTTEAVASETSSDVYLEYSSGSNHTHFGGGLNFELAPHLETRLGGSLFSSNDVIYLGFDVAGRIKFKVDNIEPFVGLGTYLGDNKKCEYSYDEYGNKWEECEKAFLFANYLEAGLRYENISIFTRVYSINDRDISLPKKYLWGINLFF